MLPIALFLAAYAGEDACTACCRAGGLSSCDTELEVYGEGSRLSRDPDGWRVTGLWRIGCGGPAIFVASGMAILDHPPLGGELIMPVVNPLQVHCFQQACGLPAGTCVSPPDEDGRFFLTDCSTGLPADANALGRAPASGHAAAAKVVVVDGRPLVVQPGTSSTTSAAARTSPATAPAAAYTPPAAAYTPPAPAYTPPAAAYTPPAPAYTPPPAATPPAPASATTSWSAPAPAAATTSWSAPAEPAPTTTTSWSAPATPSTAPASPTGASAPAAAIAPGATPTPGTSAADPLATFASTLPKDPPETCKPPAEALRGEARKRVDMGDEKRIRKDAAGALQEYRAALSMDLCNAYGWLGVGEIASQAARPDLAVRALRNATRLLPGHYGAWVMLGKAYEGLRQTQLAAEAYGEALALRPNLQDALDGWRRTASPGSAP